MYLKALTITLAITTASLLYLMVVELNPFIKRCNPDVCHDYALSAFKVHSVMHMGANNCDYGVLPGFLSFNVMKSVGERWQTATPKCRLKNLMAADAKTGPVKVMLFGDSVDAHMAQEWCMLLQQPFVFTPTGLKGNVAAFAASVKAKATGKKDIGSSSNREVAGSSNSNSTGGDADEGCCKDRDVFYYCKPKDPGAADRISIGMFHLPGVHLDGPFHTGVKGNFLTRIPTALKTYNQTFGGPPDLVIMHSNFWDQSRMWEQQQAGYGQLNKLMPDVVFSYSSNFSLLLSNVKEYLPAETLIATRTAAFPTFSANWLGRWSYIHQLNMAATEVTRLHGLPVIDLGGMVFGLEPKQYLDDQHHPNKVVLLECANIALNLLAQQRSRVDEEETADAIMQQQQQPSGKSSKGSGRQQPEAAAPGSTTSSSSSSKTPVVVEEAGVSSSSSREAAGKQQAGGGSSSSSQLQEPTKEADGVDG